jgi:retron-type reverse transcriptase
VKIGNNGYIIKDQNGRECQTPKGRYKKNSLYKIHNKIDLLLSSIDTPEYLFSGKKGKSCLDNAKFHLENHNKIVVKLDIRKFFPSIKFSHIFDFFNNTLSCSWDVATLLTKLSTYNNHLPTGSPLSGRLSYFAHKKMFDDISEKAEKNNCKISVWADDIVISGDNAKKVAWEAKVIIHNRGLKYHTKKFKVYLPSDNKEITGIIITSEGKIDLRNRSRKKIYELKNKKDKSIEEIATLKGCLNEAKQILIR